MSRELKLPTLLAFGVIASRHGPQPCTQRVPSHWPFFTIGVGCDRIGKWRTGLRDRLRFGCVVVGIVIVFRRQQKWLAGMGLSGLLSFQSGKLRSKVGSQLPQNLRVTAR
jgi:hypothetical protein